MAQITHQIQAGVCIISLQGEFTDWVVRDFQDYIQPFIEDQTIKGILLDLGTVSFLTSSGIGSIALAYKTLQDRDAKLALFNLSERANQIISLTKIGEKIKIFTSKEAALSHFN